MCRLALWPTQPPTQHRDRRLREENSGGPQLTTHLHLVFSSGMREDLPLLLHIQGARGDGIVEALRYKPEGSGFDPQCCHRNHSGLTTALESTQPSTDVSIRNYFLEGGGGGESGRCVRLTALLPSCTDCLEIWEPQPRGVLRACNRPAQGLC